MLPSKEVLLAILVCLLGDIEGTSEKMCPDPLFIIPCTCEMKNGDLFLDCSDVTSEEELFDLLTQPFPYYNFKSFIISHNHYLKVLRAGTFGDLTFEKVELRVGNIETIESGVFLGSASTLTKFKVFNHELSSFPFEEVEKYEKLGSLAFPYNNIHLFPVIKSSSLYKLDMSRNPLHTVGGDSLQCLPNLEDVSFEACQMTEVFPGTFTRLPKLNTVSVYSNNISHLPSDLMQLHGPNSYVYMGINGVASIEAGAIKGVSHFFDLDFNALTEVSEDVWRPILERGTGVYFVGNPLTCDCDIQWLIENPRFMSQLDPYAACANGTLLRDLEPASFASAC